MRARVFGANPRSAKGLPGMDDHKPVVPGTEVRVLPQTVRRNPLARSSASATGFRTQDCRMEQGSCRKAAGSVGDTLARLLELPYGRNLSAGTSRIGRGSTRDPAAHEHLEVDETSSLGDESRIAREGGTYAKG